MEDAPIVKPISSPSRASTGVSRVNGNALLSPSIRSTSNTNYKRTHDEFAGGNNVWSETRFRSGHGIRLLRLHGGASDAPLQGRLILSDGKETYEALSYGGEPEDGTGLICIFSASSTYEMAIKPNLEAALRQLRLPDKYRLLWIDSICINQGDITERNFHIQRMGSIFNTASNVCVWIGTGDDQSATAFKFIRTLEDAPGINLDSNEEDTKQSLDALIRLLKRRSFTRRWAIQEVALAKRATLHCGQDYVSWAGFADAISLIHSNLSRLLPRNAPEVGARASASSRILATTAGSHFVDVSSNIFRKSDKGTILDSLQSLEALMCNLSSFETSNFHDNIYAYLSLAEDTGARYSVRAAAAFSMEGDDTGVEPVDLSPTERKNVNEVVKKWQRAAAMYRVDYAKSAVEVCRDFVAFVINKTRSLDIICRPWAPAAYRTQMPSWVATLADREFHNGLYTRAQAEAFTGVAGIGKRPYNASRGYPIIYSFGEQSSSTSLFADGCILDSIEQRRVTADNGIPPQWRELGGWEEGARSPPERFWRTLIANRGQDASNPPHYFEKACKFVYTEDSLSAHAYSTRVGTEVREDHPEFVAEFLQRVQSIIWKRRMILTEQEQLLGLAPEAAQEGDLICIIFGCSVPVVLRKIVSDEMTGEHHYALLGDCYVHGMMDGEAFTMQQTRNIPQTQFEIR